MKKLTLLIILLGASISSMFAQGKTDYFGVPGPVRFNNETFLLSDSYHPETYYFKQEYIPSGENPDKFSSMVTIDLLTADITPRDAVTQKISEIETIKKSDPIAHYSTYDNSKNGEYMLDFLLSQIENDKVALVEWNIYRYTAYKDKSGKTGVLLFAYSKRAYGDNVTPFLKNLKTYKAGVIKNMSVYKLPSVQLK